MSTTADDETRVDDRRLRVTRPLSEGVGASLPVDEPPERIGRFEILERVGAGGMGVVYRARDPKLGRDVALKVVRTHLPCTDPERLRREARALAALSHPHVVQVFEVGEDAGCLYITMEYVPGRTLREWLRTRPAKAEVAARLLEVARGLAAAHDAGVLHRDIKPSNIYVGDDGRARLLDFGLARGLDEAEVEQPWAIPTMHLGTDLGDALTETGVVMGTPLYMSPEQSSGHPPTAAGDQFELCVTAYEALVGVHPFGGRPAIPVDGALPVEPVAGRLDPLVARVRPLLLRGLSPSPQARWSSMTELVQALEQAIAPRSGRSRRGTAAAAVAVAGLAVAVAVWAPRDAEVPVPAACAHGSSLAAVWSPERRDALRSAISATGLDYAAHTAVRVVADLDAHAHAWEAAHAEACAGAARPDAGASLEARLACLERERASMVAVLDVLAEPDPNTLPSAIELTEGLELPSRCGEPAYLRRQPTRPTDPATLAAVAEVEPLLAELEAVGRGGRYDRVLELVEQLDRVLEGIAHPPLQVEIDVGTGLVLAQLERDRDAEPRLERGFFQAQALGMDAMAFEAASSLASLVTAQGGRIDEGLAWVRHAEAMLEPQGDEDRRAWLSLHRGQVLEVAGRMPEAIAELEHAVGLIEGFEERPTLMLAQGLGTLARVLAIHERSREAEAHLRRALAIQRELVGDHHPSLVPFVLNLGSTLSEQGREEEALASYEEALTLLDGSGGRRQPMSVTVLYSMGNVLRELGRHEEALARLEEAREISTATQGPDHPVLSEIDNNTALVLHALGREDEALELLRRALQQRHDALGPGHPGLLPPMVNLGDALLDLGREDEAATHLERALEISRGEGASDMDRAMTLGPAARLARMQGRFAEAIARAQRAVQLFEQTAPRTAYASWARFELALALVAAGRDRTHALALARRARDELAAQGGAQQDAHDEIVAWLAEQADGR